MGQGEYEVLSRQGIKALMATPLVVNDHVYGFMGVDLVDGSASWSDEDYRWLSSLANVISICLELRRAKEKVIFEQAALARSERHLQKHLCQYSAEWRFTIKRGIWWI